MPGLKLQKVQVPHYFRCPISLDLMRDPVTVATGQTYDRASIEKWVADGNRTCPATMQQLHDLNLIPNHTLRRLIQEWCVANRARGVERIPTPKQPADPRRIESLLRDCSSSSSSSSGSCVVAALRSLRGLAKESDKNKALIAEAGAVPVLISAMFRRLDEDETEKGSIRLSSSSSSEDDDLEVAEEALGVLVLLPMGEAERSAVAESRDRLALVAGILQRGRSMDARINAAQLVEKLAADATEGVKRAVGDSAGLMEGLVALLQGPEAMSPRAAKAGVRALFSLCLSASPSNSERAVAAGAAAALVEHLPEAQAGDADRTLGTLELLCRTVAGREAVGGHALAVPALVAAILRSDAVRSSNRPSCQATECAAGTLLAICSSSEAVQRAAVQAGVLTQLLLLIQSDCTGRAKRKAMELLKLLRSSWTEDPCLVELERTDVVAF